MVDYLMPNSFFESIEIKKLMRFENGYKYLAIYLKICLYTIQLNEDDVIVYAKHRDEDIDDLAVVADVECDEIEKALEVFEKCHLVSTDEDGDITIEYI